MKKRAAIVLLIIIALMSAFSGCSDKKSETDLSDQPVRKVIIDTDTGADDASAIILAACSENLDILGVTTLVGNVDEVQCTKNALAALEIAGSDAPVYKGASENYSGDKIEAFSVFGKDGMGEADLIHPTRTAEDKDAIDFIIETVKNNPDEIEIIAIGPATNIAKAIEKDPETMKKVKRIWSMGTCGQGVGNASPVAEFNVYADPYAYKVMLDSGIDITIVGLDMCNGEAQWTNEQFEKLKKVNDAGMFTATAFDKIREFYASNGSADSVMNCDSVAMSCVVYPDFVTDTVQCHGSCITEAGETFAEVLFYKEGFTYDNITNNDFDYNVCLVSGVKKDEYFDRYYDSISKLS